MPAHRTIDLSLREDKPKNVYRMIEEWESVPSSHGSNISYLLLFGVFQWGADRGTPVRGFSIAMQYSAEIGKRVDVSQPAHITLEDTPRVLSAMNAFIARCT